MKNINSVKRRQATGIGKILVLILVMGGTVAAASVLPFVQFEAQSPDDNNPPFAPAVVVNPRLPATTDDLVCSITAPSSDPDGDDTTYIYQWYLDDVLQDKLTSDTVSSTYTAKSQVWRCVVTATDGTDVSAAASDDVTVLNSTPTAPVVEVTPDFPVTTDDLVCSITSLSSDADEDEVVYTYQWYKNGVQQMGLSTKTVNFSLTAPGDTWKSVVISSDGEDSNAGSFDEVTIVNSTPIAPVLDIIPDFPVTTDDLVCSITSLGSDPDGNEIAYTYQWYKDDELQTELTTNTVDSSRTAKGEMWRCVVSFNDGTGPGADTFAGVTIHNSSPSAPVIDVTPDHPGSADNLLCSIVVIGSDPDGDEITYLYQWYRDDELQTELTTNTIASTYTAKDEVWRCVVTASDGIAATAATFDEVTVGDDTANSPPTTPVVKVTPELPVTTDNLVCSITTQSIDPDGDTVTYSYQWHKDGVLQEGLTTSTLSSSYTAKGRAWRCVVTATDGIDSSSGGLDEVTILNSAPAAPIVDITPDFPIITDHLVCTVTTQSSDPDGDTVTYSYQWYKDGVLQEGLATSIVDSIYTAKGEVWRCVVTASDGTDSSAGASDEVTISNSAPAAPGVDSIPDHPVTTDDLVCTVTTQSSDPDEDTVTYSYQWYKDGVLQEGLTTSIVYSIYTARGEGWRCVVTASDGTDSSAGGFDSVTVYNSPPTSPVVAITPRVPVSTDNLVCTITTQSSDPDGDSVEYSYAWYNGDALQADLTTKSVPSSRTADGDTWKCEVTASDGMDSSSTGFDQVTVTSDAVDVFVVAYDSSQADKDQADYVCDGSHDDVQIQAAIDSLESGGGTVYIAEGTYVAENTIDVRVDDITITGEGNIIRTFGGDGLFYIKLCNNFRMEGLELEDTEDHYYALLRIEGCTNTHISDNVLHDMTNAIWLYPNNTTATKSSNISITGNEIYNFGYAAIMMRNGCEHVTISGNEIHDGSRVDLADPHLYAIASDNIGGWSTDMPVNEWVSITDNTIYNMDYHNAIDMHGENHLEIRGNHISNIEFTPIFVHTAVHVGGLVTELSDWEVVDNVIEGCNSDAIRCFAEYGITVEDILVSGNTIESFATRGVWIGTDSDGNSNFHDVSVSGNEISGHVVDSSSGVGIRVSGRSGQVSSDDFEIKYNVISEAQGDGNFERAIVVYYMENGTIEGNEISGIPEYRWYGIWESTDVVVVS